MIGSTSTWYLFVGSRSEGVQFSDLPFFSLMGVPAATAPDAQANAKAESRP